MISLFIQKWLTTASTMSYVDVWIACYSLAIQIGTDLNLFSCFCILCFSTVVETPPHKMRKFIVYEENLIELFRKCPVCTRSCITHLRTVGTLLCVDQVCTHCEHQKTWTSQPYVTNIPAGNIQLSAAVIFSGASFVHVEKARHFSFTHPWNLCAGFSMTNCPLSLCLVLAGIQHIRN